MITINLLPDDLVVHEKTPLGRFAIYLADALFGTIAIVWYLQTHLIEVPKISKQVASAEGETKQLRARAAEHGNLVARKNQVRKRIEATSGLISERVLWTDMLRQVSEILTNQPAWIDAFKPRVRRTGRGPQARTEIVIDMPSHVALKDGETKTIEQAVTDYQQAFESHKEFGNEIASLSRFLIDWEPVSFQGFREKIGTSYPLIVTLKPLGWQKQLIEEGRKRLFEAVRKKFKRPPNARIKREIDGIRDLRTLARWALMLDKAKLPDDLLRMIAAGAEKGG